jgi:7-cyano-7-deazaguanine synthase
METKEDLVVLFSGGADSTLLLKLAEKLGKKVFALMIDYGQLHKAELEYAKKYLDNHKINNMTVTISGYDVNSGLTGSGEKGLYEGVDIHNVPTRNSIFLSLAYGISESKGIQEIWYGANWEDYDHLFPDCTQEYIGRMNKVLEIAGVKPIKIYAPLLGMEKYMIKDLLRKEYGIDASKDLYSGYGEFK